jgi:glycine cleavage system aminomethyltransferase T
VIGRLRSVAFGPTVSRTIGYVYRPADVDAQADLTIDVFDQRVAARWTPDVLVDPTGERMRG